MRPMNGQGEFDFSQTGHEHWYERWLSTRNMAATELACRTGLPVGQLVEVWLSGNIRLRGKLRLHEESLLVDEERVRHLELSLNNVHFAYREVESCVRLD